MPAVQTVATATVGCQVPCSATAPREEVPVMRRLHSSAWPATVGCLVHEAVNAAEAPPMAKVAWLSTMDSEAGCAAPSARLVATPSAVRLGSWVDGKATLADPGTAKADRSRASDATNQGDRNS